MQALLGTCLISFIRSCTTSQHNSPSWRSQKSSSISILDRTRSNTQRLKHLPSLRFLSGPGLLDCCESLGERCLHSTVADDDHEINVLTVALVNQDRENNIEKRSQGLKSEKEALLIGIISTFLHVHPFGANIEYLWSYMQQLDSKISANEIEMLLMRLPRMFKQEFTGVGATLEKRWKLCAFEGIKTT
nr:PREDICTED: ecto-NOX disulfide-thiol exchanger 1-like [Equus przewalskii]